jgi:hypothetical protein
MNHSPTIGKKLDSESNYRHHLCLLSKKMQEDGQHAHRATSGKT